ncbi:MAG: hypothetical protein U9O97_01940 [Elusimicrobiota bacterium]|nr:hypothetical protein [Elusimicrobiota bacterium]
MKYELIAILLLLLLQQKPAKAEEITGNGFISKSLYYEQFDSRDRIWILQSESGSSKCSDKIIISGRHKTQILDAQSKILKRQLTPRIGCIIVGLADVDKDGVDEIIERDGGPASKISGCGIFKDSGEPIWWYDDLHIRQKKYKEHVRDLLWGDLDRDGDIEFYVACDSEGLVKLDRFGKKVWQHRHKRGRMTAQCLGVEKINLDERKPLLAASFFAIAAWPWSNNKLIQILDLDGNLIREFKPKGSGMIQGTKFVQWLGQPCLFVGTARGMRIYNLYGDILFKYSTKYLQARIFDCNAVTVKFENNKEPYLAALIRSRFITKKRYSTLLIFSPRKEIVYKEVFPQELTTALCTIPSDVSGQESLLIGLGNKIWRYDTTK